jgi:hypothetical protein
VEMAAAAGMIMMRTIAPTANNSFIE